MVDKNERVGLISVESRMQRTRSMGAYDQGECCNDRCWKRFSAGLGYESGSFET